MLKFIIGWLLVLALRLVPFRPANVEPLMATLMPFSKKYGWVGGFLFAFLSMVIYDVVTQKVGSWTWITATVYGLVGVGAYFFFKNRESSARHYVMYSIIGTLVFDAITGVAMGPLLYHQPFMEALAGQIPFTLRHLLSSAVSSFLLSVAIEHWIVENPRLVLSWNT
ncbi:MAG: ECF transporter S component [Patescibacteria group bacterium]